MKWELEELEFIYSHWNDEYLFFKDNAICGTILIFLSYFSYLFSMINNKNIEFGYFMYGLLIYCIFYNIYDIFKLKQAIKMRNYFDNELLIYFTKKR